MYSSSRRIVKQKHTSLQNVENDEIHGIISWLYFQIKDAVTQLNLVRFDFI